MNDPFPVQLRIEIDRPKLKAYLRTKWLLSWIILLGLFGITFGLASSGKTFDHNPFSLRLVLITSTIHAGIGLALALSLGGLCYFTFSHRAAARFADHLEIAVEGSFLRIRQNMFVATDRKFHFRSIVDYAVTQDAIMRYFQISTLQMTTTGSGPTSTITIPGVKECLQIRDMLSEIDRLRENAP